MSETPVEITIAGLKDQISEIQEIINELGTSNKQDRQAPISNESTLKELEELKAENGKLEYRIRFLLKALDEKDHKINELVGKNRLDKK